VLSVADDGPGLSPVEQELVFERFWRSDASRSRESGGAGLGLAIVRRIAESHGGAVGVASESGAGSTFEVRLPL
jgi:signal transduction histidine kinase